LTELTPELTAGQRARVIVSYLTRMRVCAADGRMDLAYKGPAEGAPVGFLPWFAHAERKTRDIKVLFGHWAALAGRVAVPNVYALDTGCVWGKSLTTLRLEDGLLFAHGCGDGSPTFED
jgi:bis(5'-nucleosyl)-tetraphosphatase (symmetrical)